MERQRDYKIVKILLLGPGESGKSTVLKQMRIIHMDGFSDSEKEARKPAVYANVFQNISMLLAGIEQLNLPLPVNNQELTLINERGIFNTYEVDVITPGHKILIDKIWHHPSTKTAYENRSEFQLNDSAKYFLDNLDRLCNRNYVPTVQDILMCRVPTTGVQEIQYDYQGIAFRIFDVGGQKSERRKWLNHFDNVTAVLFIAAISEYDQTMREVEGKNRMIDTLRLFADIVNSQFFVNSSVILFLNKKDLFEEKIKRIPLTVCFKKYKGDNSFEATTNFLRRCFEKLKSDDEKLIYTHLTWATQTDQVERVLSNSIDMIISENFKQAGVL
ncbi:hypothetical protein WR25_17066 [Diploscapter pachys]|uniref:G-protein alpha subunit n=1 Tax=Diploscapter pachys TaxID=2018661 RepID=A0A2A2L3W3_9BILA|nr:hypothetical protein WR25_17066 [Diploscapter pachys]